MFKSLKNINIIIFTDNINNGLTKEEYKSFLKEYSNVKISFKKTNNKFHDRYIIIDYNLKSERIFHSGASFKDAGKRITTITEIENRRIYHSMIKNILNNKDLFV